MEMDLLKETWPTIDLFDNPNTQKTSMAEEENSVFSIWEENYQDLSGWCIDAFQGRCAFPIGEFEANKYSGTKSEDNGVSIKKAGVIGKVSRGLHGDKESLEESSLKVPELGLVEAEARNQVGDFEQLAIKSEIMDTRSIKMNDVLLLDPIDSSINQTTDDWIQLANVKARSDSKISVQNVSINHNEKKSNVISAEYPRTIPHEVAKEEKDSWDTINTFDNTESETFDLLSYLCDDNIQSPDGSVVSRDSGPTIKSSSSIASHIDETSALTRDLPRNGRRSGVILGDYASASSSTSSSSIAAISAALDSVAKMSRRTSRDRQKRLRSTRHEYDDIVEKKSRGKKRCVDSDSEDRTSDGSYRESREKNNEASRKSRQNKKAKENEMMARASELERDNRILKMKVEELDKLVTSMRTAILRSALKNRAPD